MSNYKHEVLKDINRIDTLLDDIINDDSKIANNLETIHGLVSRVEYLLYEESQNDD